MPQKQESDGRSRYQLNLAGIKPDEERPKLVVVATDENRKQVHVADVDERGGFDLPEKALKAAHRITIGPKPDGDNPMSDESARYRASDFAKLIEAGSINISRRLWEKWYFLIRCVSGRVRLCRRRPWWYYELYRVAALPRLDLQRTAAVKPTVSLKEHAATLQPSQATSISELIYWPFRCETICNGTVEVYRRRCCCRPWILDDIRLPELVIDLEDIIRRIPKDLPFPHDPNPPDPSPIEQAFLKDGSLDELAVNARQDLDAIKRLPRAEVAAYVNARPYLLCRRTCSKPVKVAEGRINPDGRFNICWLDRPRPTIGFCHDEYAYVVKQTLGFFTFTVYNGVAANIWFHYDDDPLLTSYSRYAFACRDNGEPGSGAYVFLDLIGDTESWNLKTPNATGWDRVAAPAYNDGLSFPSATPAAAVGAYLNRNWGGTLKLNYKFSEDMRLLDAKYYRISVVESDASGNPVGPAPAGDRYYLSDGLSWEKSVSDGMGGADIVPVSLGPFTVGGEDNLFLIPYDNGPAPNGGDWNAGQYHGYLNTNDARWNDPTKRHLLTVEVFDSTGRRMRPNGTPATGLPGTEVTAPFTYRRRYQDTGPTANVPFGALTHMFWWDNRGLTAVITHLNKDGMLFNSECLFFQGSAGSTFGVGYRAYHPNEMFQLSHGIWWKRGLGSVAGSTGTLLSSSSVNVGQPPALPGDSPTNTFAQMLRTDLDPTRKKCAFTVFLNIGAKTFDGENLVVGNVQDSAAFAIEIN